MSTLQVGTIKSASSAAPVFKNSSDVEIGQLAFAWYTVDPSGSSSLSDSFNISSVNEVNQNTYTMSFARAASNANYAVAIDVQVETNHFTNNHTTSGFDQKTGGNLSNQKFSAIIFGS